MKNKMIMWVPSVLILLISVIVLVSGSYLKQPLTGNDDVIANIESVEQAIEKKEWAKANKQLEEGLAAWEKVKGRIQYSVERDFILEIDNKFATIKGALKAKDVKKIITTTEEFRFVWNELGK